jgi:DnaJ-class molecular chaperone
MKQYHPDMHSRDASKKKVADELCAELTRAYQELERVLAAQT